MKDYIKQFHPRFVGLTGSEDQVRKVTKAYRVYFNPTNEDDENYLVSRCHVRLWRHCPHRPLSCCGAGRVPAHMSISPLNSVACSVGGSFNYRLPSQSRRRVRGFLWPGGAGSDDDSEG